MRIKRKSILRTILILFVLGFLIPENFKMPVKGARSSDYNKESFWYYPWGKSGTHKGVDVFGKIGQELQSSVNGLVVYTGELRRGGNVVLILGPKWRFHYYAHLNTIETTAGSLVTSGERIGSLGDSGNAKGKQPHLHYSIVTFVPHVWNIDTAPQGWKKMFYVNPIPLLN